MLTTIEKVIFLQDVDLFSEVSTEQLSYLAAIVEERSYGPAEPIYKAQELADAMYLVIEGEVRLHLNDLEVDTVGPGKAFGTWALVDDEPRVTTATPTQNARVLRLDKEDFIDLLADNVEITQAVLKALVKRMRGLMARATTHSEKPPYK